jgi:hypothetical protein
VEDGRDLGRQEDDPYEHPDSDVDADEDEGFLGGVRQQQQQQQYPGQPYRVQYRGAPRAGVPTSLSEGEDEDESLTDSEGYSLSEDEEDGDAVHSQPTPSAAAATAVATGGAGTVRQDTPSGRYNLRQRRSPGL